MRTFNIRMIRKTFFKAIKIFLPVSVIIIATSILFYYSHVTPHTKVQKQSEELIISLQKKYITKELKRIINDTIFLARLQKFNHLYNSDKQIHLPSLNELANEFLDKSIINRDYDQIRFLNLKGDEVIRINFNNGAPYIVPQNKLQNKLHRYYFKNSINLNYNSIYLSKFDLNIENKKIEIPLKPMIRIGTPVYTRKGKKIGIILVNYFGKLILDRLAALDSFKKSDSILLNNEGYWIKSTNPSDEWGHMYENKKQLTFKSKYQNEWSEINKRTSGQIINSNGLFTFTSFFPNNISQNNLAKNKLNQNRWILVSHIPYHIMRNHRNTWRLWSSVTITILLIIWGLVSFIISRGNITQEILISKQSELINEVKNKNNELVLSNKKMNKFVGILSHDIRNPIGRIISFCDILKEKKIDDKSHEIYNIINRSACEAIDLVTTVLDMAALKLGHIDIKLDKYNIHTIIDETIHGLIFLARKKQIMLVNNVDIDTIVKIDSQRIAQVLGNLITNAIKFSKQNSQIIIKSEIFEKRIKIVVEDHGEGILQENISKLFDKSVPFSTIGTDSEKGTGLGLALCQDMLKSHNSKLKVDSSYGKGSKFYFELDII